MENINVIQTRNLTKRYYHCGGHHRGIENINLEIPQGEIYGFIGPNGAGKSTTIRTLLGLIFPTAGEASVFGLDSTKDHKKICSRIGFIPSEVNYYQKMSTRELLNYSASFYTDGKKGRKTSDYRRRMDHLAEIFNVDMAKDISELSLGNKKKVSILQSLIHSPELLILDEPTSGLDPLMQARFFEVLEEENRNGATIFFSSHTLSEVQQFCKRVGIIKEGKMIKEENVDSLRKKHLKRISVELKTGQTNRDFSTPGISELEWEKNRARFLFSGEVKSLLGEIAATEVINMTMEEPTLEEIFMHYYQEEQGE